MDDLVLKLKNDIIETLKLEDVKPEDIDPSAPLFGEGLGLDSIDALELVVVMEKNYGIKLDSAELARKVLYSIDTLAKYITENGKNDP